MPSLTSVRNRVLPSAIEQSPQYKDGRFHNLAELNTLDWSKLPAFLWRLLREKRVDRTPSQSIPVQAVDETVLANLPDDRMTLFRLGHSSFLFKAVGSFFLIDPVFSERASPWRFVGPKRFHQPPLSIDALPPIKAVIISHNHYDHLDENAIKALIGKVEHFVVPLAVGAQLERWGVDAARIVELDWWQDIDINGLHLTATPAQHFSGRGLRDGNTSLWCSFVIKTPSQSIFYSGDSGYFEGFRLIGKQYGPFDLAIIETGAYDKDWPDVHMTPEQSLQAYLDVGAARMLPAHNGTFDLAFHPWYEPLERIKALADKADIKLITPLVGEAIDIATAEHDVPWWRGLNP